MNLPLPLPKPDLTKTRTELARLIDRGATFVDKAVDGGFAQARSQGWNLHALLDGNLHPAWQASLQLQRAFRGDLLDVLRGKRDLMGFVTETQDRVRSAARFKWLVDTLGKAAFGSARFPGETKLAEHGAFRLSYLPPKEGVPRQDVALFHVGGVIPYGEGLYRLTPEFTLYDRFLERGMPVYVMEINGDSSQVDYASMTMDGLVHATKALSDKAFEHNAGKKMVLEGYCGAGTQALVYLAALPEDVERKFFAFASFVTPIDGKKCGKLAESIQRTPDDLMKGMLDLWQQLNMTVPADSLRMSLDLTLGSLFYKTLMGYVTAGWMRTDFARVSSDSELTPQQRRDLAGAYWISPDSARRFPVPVDMTRFTSAMFTKGVGRDGKLPWTFEGRELSLGDTAAKTSIKVMGFYGSEDPVIPEHTGLVMGSVFGDRYTHVVHQGAGHVSYVLSPKTWNKDHPRGAKPNPIDLMLAAAPAAKAPAAAKKATAKKATAKKATTKKAAAKKGPDAPKAEEG